MVSFSHGKNTEALSICCVSFGAAFLKSGSMLRGVLRVPRKKPVDGKIHGGCAYCLIRSGFYPPFCLEATMSCPVFRQIRVMGTKPCEKYW